MALGTLAAHPASLPMQPASSYVLLSIYLSDPFYCTVMFEIELLSFVDLKVADDFGHLSKEDKENVSLDELLSVANAIREVSFAWLC